MSATKYEIVMDLIGHTCIRTTDSDLHLNDCTRTFFPKKLLICRTTMAYKSHTIGPIKVKFLYGILFHFTRYIYVIWYRLISKAGEQALYYADRTSISNNCHLSWPIKIRTKNFICFPYYVNVIQHEDCL